MSTQIRINRLVQLLMADPHISIDELAARLAIPASIIRRDLARTYSGKR